MSERTSSYDIMDLSDIFFWTGEDAGASMKWYVFIHDVIFTVYET